MRRPPAPVLLALLAALVVTAASCENGGSDRATGATVPTEAPTTSPATTSAEESFAIPADPADIDVAYANRVMAALKRITGDLVRKVVATRLFEPQDLLALRAAYADEAVESQAEGFVDIVTVPDDELKQPPGDNVVDVLRVVGATRDCLYLEATVDISPTVAGDPPPRRTFIELRAAGPDSDPAAINPTPWVMVAEDDAGRNPCR